MNKRKSQNNEYSIYRILDLVQEGNIQEIQKLVSLDNSIIYQQDENGTTLLMEASSSGHLELVKFLVEVGSDVNQLDIYGGPALLDAAYEGHWEIFEYLFDLTNQELKESCLFEAAIDGELDILKALVKKQVNVNACRMKGVWCDNGFTALIAIIDQGDEEFVDIVKTLLDAGADPNLPEEDTGGTPLIYAAKRGCPKIMCLLLKAGADPNVKNTYSKTALVYAKEKEDSKIVQLLLDSGAIDE